MVNIRLFDTPDRAIPLAIAIYLSVYVWKKPEGVKLMLWNRAVNEVKNKILKK